MNTNTEKLNELFSLSDFDEFQNVKNPMTLFDNWLNAAIEKKIIEPNAMMLATADSSGKPSARIVLLKEYNENGFVFYSNYTSRKGKDLEENPAAALVFWWGSIIRQVRVEGVVEKTSDEESDLYFSSRPRGSQISALASNQSKPIPNYAYLKNKFDELTKQLENREIPRPEYWGGYRVKPFMIEFWQARDNRLNDRIRFTKNKSGDWDINRLSP
jgi:pyridoxamine 5'-phosphate oxidase